ncbi:MAG: MFS transporter [Planctomycetota bacterium]|nr:MFS transporter [Planctomycetota bacterium]
MSTRTGGLKEILILSAAFFFSYLGVGAIQPFLTPYLEEETDRPGTEVVWVLGSVYLAGIFMRLVAALMVNKLGARMTVILGLLMCTGFSWLIVVTTHIGILLFGAFFWGWGAGCIWVAGTSMVLDFSPEDRYGTNTSILFAAVYLGQGAGVCLLGWIGAKFGKADLFFWAAVISIPANVVSFMFPKAGGKTEPANLAEGMKVLVSLQGIIVSVLLLSSSFGFGILLGNLSGSVARSTEMQGFGSVGPVTLGFYVARLVCTSFAGPLSDRFGRAPLLVVAYAASAIGLFAAGASDSPEILFAAALSLGVQMGIASVAVGALVGDWAPPEKRHVLLGSLYIWHGLGAALSLILGEQLKAWLNAYRPTFTVFGAVMALCAILAVVLGFLLRKEKRSEQKAASEG